MKSDEVLKHDIEQELLWGPAIDAEQIRVKVNARIVTLAGSVSSCAQKLAAQKAVQRVAGSRAVVLELTVRRPSPTTHSDEELAAAIVSALKWQEGFEGTEVRVEVDRGCVTLSGEVTWVYQRHAAEMLVSRMRGVVGVANQLAVRSNEIAKDVHAQIAAALARRSLHEAVGISVDAHDGVVRLTGTVNSLADKRAACNAAWGAKGVRWVVDQVNVA
ncbi:BON domain-containing protein [Caballeronia humi]|uniref:BON domain protein n=1 Tax=Caballeronia humi TaxID=326474 RepID=A0A158JNR5_9BURK|nr:BON domain-containing protein [Caballeronia humi]SAL70071.1 BON domain protein [Caballeronia humi]